MRKPIPEEERCEAELYAGPASTSPPSCPNRWAYEEPDGRRHCGQHSSERIAARKAARKARELRELKAHQRATERWNQGVKRQERRAAALEELLVAAKALKAILDTGWSIELHGGTAPYQDFRAAIKKVEETDGPSV